MAGSAQEHQAAVQEIQDMLAQMEGQHEILVSALKRKHVSTLVSCFRAVPAT